MKEAIKAPETTDQELQEELDEFLAIDDSHKEHFPGGAPSVPEWVRLRQYFAEAEHKDSAAGSALPTHSRQISVFVRDPHSLTKERLNELIERLHEMVPEAELPLTHGRIRHDKGTCPEGDLFAHPGAKSHTEATEEYEQQLAELAAKLKPGQHNEL